MARTTSDEPGASTATLELAWMVSAAVAVLAPVVGIAFGLHFVLAKTANIVVYNLGSEDQYVGVGRVTDQHATLGLGTVVIIGGVLLGVLALVLAISVHSQVAPRLRAERLAAARAIADEQR